MSLTHTNDPDKVALSQTLQREYEAFKAAHPEKIQQIPIGASKYNPDKAHWKDEEDSFISAGKRQAKRNCHDLSYGSKRRAA